MVINEKAEKIKEALNKEYPQTKTFLNYTKDYELLFAVILSAQATDKSVNDATGVLFKECPMLSDYTCDKKERIYAIIKRIGLAKSKTEYLLSTARILREEYHGILPHDRKELMKLPGVGYKTSGVVLSELGIEDFFPVDTHVQRVSKRLGLIRKETPEETETVLERIFQGSKYIILHRQFILFGRNICKAANPSCVICPLKELCTETKRK